MAEQDNLPPLPEPDHGYHAFTGYTADQMLDYARAAVAAALSAPAQAAAQDERDDVRAGLRASIVACLGDDAARLREMHEDDGLVDEIADNMEAAADLIEELIAESTEPQPAPAALVRDPLRVEQIVEIGIANPLRPWKSSSVDPVPFAQAVVRACAEAWGITLAAPKEGESNGLQLNDREGRCCKCSPMFAAEVCEDCPEKKR